MKKHFLMATLISASCLNVNAQTLPNTSMETWVNYSAGFPPANLERPANWHSADSLIATYGLLIFGGNTQKQLFKSTTNHSGSFSARLVTLRQDTLLLPGVLANARPELDLLNFDPNDPMSAISYTGGTPITQRIQSVRAWVMYDPMASSDMGRLSVQTVLAGQGAGGTDSVVGVGTVNISGSASFTQVGTNITYVDSTVVPDKIIVLFSSSDFASMADSSTLWVDDVTMSTALGTKEVLMDGERFDVYPNPAQGELHFATSITAPLQLQIVDASGSLISQRPLLGRALLPTHAWAAGVYYYTVKNEAGDVVRKGKVLVK